MLIKKRIHNCLNLCVNTLVIEYATRDGPNTVSAWCNNLASHFQSWIIALYMQLKNRLAEIKACTTKYDASATCPVRCTVTLVAMHQSRTHRRSYQSTFGQLILQKDKTKEENVQIIDHPSLEWNTDLPCGWSLSVKKIENSFISSRGKYVSSAYRPSILSTNQFPKWMEVFGIHFPESNLRSEVGIEPYWHLAIQAEFVHSFCKSVVQVLSFPFNSYCFDIMNFNFGNNKSNWRVLSFLDHCVFDNKGTLIRLLW